MKLFVVILSVVGVVISGPVSSENSVLRTVVENFVDCVNSDLSLCLKEHALKTAERLGTARELKIIDGIILINNNPKEARSAEPLSDDPAVRNKQVSERLWDSTSAILQTSELELSYGGSDEEGSRSIEDDVNEGRGKKKKALKKKLKVLIPLLIMAKAKAVIILIFAVLVIAASLFKIALLAKIAFIVKMIAIIKALLAQKHSHEDVSIEAVPSHGWESSHVEHGHSDHGHGWEGGWSRSRNEANNLAYSAYN